MDFFSYMEANDQGVEKDARRKQAGRELARGVYRFNKLTDDLLMKCADKEDFELYLRTASVELKEASRREMPTISDPIEKLKNAIRREWQASHKTASKTAVNIGSLEIYPNDLGRMKLQRATEACANLGQGWRLPTRDELTTISENRSMIGSLKLGPCWTSTKNHIGAWTRQLDESNMSYGHESSYVKGSACYVLPVRTSNYASKKKTARLMWTGPPRPMKSDFGYDVVSVASDENYNYDVSIALDSTYILTVERKSTMETCAIYPYNQTQDYAQELASLLDHRTYQADQQMSLSKSWMMSPEASKKKSTSSNELTLVTCACGCGKQWIVPWDEYDYIKSQEGGRFYYLSACKLRGDTHRESSVRKTAAPKKWKPKSKGWKKSDGEWTLLADSPTGKGKIHLTVSADTQYGSTIPGLDFRGIPHPGQQPYEGVYLPPHVLASNPDAADEIATLLELVANGKLTAEEAHSYMPVGSDDFSALEDMIAKEIDAQISGGEDVNPQKFKSRNPRDIFDDALKASLFIAGPRGPERPSGNGSDRSKRQYDRIQQVREELDGLSIEKAVELVKKTVKENIELSKQEYKRHAESGRSLRVDSGGKAVPLADAIQKGKGQSLEELQATDPAWDSKDLSYGDGKHLTPKEKSKQTKWKAESLDGDKTVWSCTLPDGTKSMGVQGKRKNDSVFWQTDKDGNEIEGSRRTTTNGKWSWKSELQKECAKQGVFYWENTNRRGGTGGSSSEWTLHSSDGSSVRVNRGGHRDVRDGLVLLDPTGRAVLNVPIDSEDTNSWDRAIAVTKQFFSSQSIPPIAIDEWVKSAERWDFGYDPSEALVKQVNDLIEGYPELRSKALEAGKSIADRLEKKYPDMFGEALKSFEEQLAGKNDDDQAEDDGLDNDPLEDAFDEEDADEDDDGEDDDGEKSEPTKGQRVKGKDKEGNDIEGEVIKMIFGKPQIEGPDGPVVLSDWEKI